MTLKQLGSRGISHIIAPMLIVLVVAIGGTFYLVGSHASSNPYPCPNPKPTIEYGSTGNCVKFLQWQLLEVYHINPNGIDGDFGPGTRAAVESFQSSHGLSVDGVVGPLTWAKIGGVSAGGSGAVAYPYYSYFSPTGKGTGHQTGGICYGSDWCSNGGSTSAFLIFGPYLNQSGTFNAIADVTYAWIDKNGNEAYSNSDSFVMQVTDNNGKTLLGQKQVVGNSSSSGCIYYDDQFNDSYYTYCATIPLYNISISQLEVRVTGVHPSNSGDELVIDGTDLRKP